MRVIFFLMAGFGLTALAACGAPRALPLTPGPDTCRAADWAHIIGQPRAAADAVPQPKRVHHITDPVTMDLHPARRNLVIDDSGLIAQITCG